MPTEMVNVLKTVQPMSVVRGPKRRRRAAKIGESAAEAMFAEPKLCESAFSAGLTPESMSMRED